MSELAPLVAIAEAPVPDKGTAEWFSGADGERLRAASFFPDGQARGSVVVSPGRTEPIEKYFEVVQELLDRGFAVVAHDRRGQGLSHRPLPDRLKGHAAGFKSYVSDYGRLLDAFEGRLPKPWIALGHSMGGCLTLLALAHGEQRRFKAAILSAPMLGL
ncbi:MAG TPA: alpha/beta hydrolase, partial [Caulobacteraceae bacterium]